MHLDMGSLLFILLIIHGASYICRFRLAISSGNYQPFISMNNPLLYSLLLGLYKTIQTMTTSHSILHSSNRSYFPSPCLSVLNSA